MDTKIVYAAVASAQSLDSWDIENLKYIRKISRHSGQDVDTVSYIGEDPNEDEEEEKENERLKNERQYQYQYQQPHMNPTHKSPVEYKPHLPIFDNKKSNKANGINNNDTNGQLVKNSQMMTRNNIRPIEPTVKILNSDGAGGLRKASVSHKHIQNRPALDDCYLLDVVTVRNESVLAFTTNYPAIGVDSNNNNNKNNSAGSVSSPSSTTSSTSSISSGLSELQIVESKRNNNKERDFFDDEHDDEYHCESARRQFYFNSYGRKMSGCSAGSRSPTSVSNIISRENHRRNPSKPKAGNCPFCDHANPFLDVEQTMNLEDLSMQVTVGEPEPITMPRSPSPYYVRLRRDLLTAITPPPHHSKINRPRNFSVNPHGQLAIDYSSNWNRLDQYVKNLKRS